MENVLLITKKQYYTYNFYPRKLFKSLIKSRKKLYPDSLILSALGARICYSSDHPLDVLTKDPRVADPKERLEFLKRCFKAGHYSVFAHSPIFLSKEFSYDIILLGNIYKLWIFPIAYKKIYICANARHVVELYSSYEIEVTDVKDNFYEIFIQKKSPKEKWPESLKFLWVTEEGIYTNPETAPRTRKGVLCLYIQEKPWQWFSFLAYGYSRCFSHQFVRHTWLNFCQRSHRYTQVEDIVCPESVEKNSETKSLFYRTYHIVKDTYSSLIKQYEIRKEDARFIMPAGSTTTIIASGPRFVWEDFVEKRCHPKAQWEIREFASTVKTILDKTTR